MTKFTDILNVIRRKIVTQHFYHIFMHNQEIETERGNLLSEKLCNAFSFLGVLIWNSMTVTLIDR